MSSKISKETRIRLKQEASETGLSYNIVKNHYFKALRLKKGTQQERITYFNNLNKETIEKQNSAIPKNECPIAVLRNPILIGMLRAEKFKCKEINDTKYVISIGKDTMTYKNHSGTKVLSYEQLILLSAIYSQMMNTTEKLDYDGRYRISLRSIHEYLHGNRMKWCSVKPNLRKITHISIRLLYDMLNRIEGVYEYSYKDIRKRLHTMKTKFDVHFFLKIDWHNHPSQAVEEEQEWEKNGYADTYIYVKPTPMFEIVKLQKCFTTLPAEMLDIKNSHDFDALKYYLAYRVMQSRKSDKLTCAVSYNTLEELFGDDNRDFVKRYFKFLEDKGHIKELHCDKDAVRWSNK